MSLLSTTFLSLWVIHILADFYLQPRAWLSQKRQNHHRSWALLVHCLIHALLTGVFLLHPASWWVPISVFMTHWLIDWWKSYRPKNLQYFLIDQALHLAVIASISMVFHWQDVRPWSYTFIADQPDIIATSLGVLLSLSPINVAVTLFMKKFKLDKPDRESLMGAGRWIGYFERILIFVGMLASAYTVLGFMVAAKTLLHFSNRNNDKRAHTEYVLLGSFFSWTAAVVIAACVKMLLR